MITSSKCIVTTLKYVNDLYQHANCENMQNVESIENNSSEYFCIDFYIYQKWCFATVHFNVDLSCITKYLYNYENGHVFDWKIFVRDIKIFILQRENYCCVINMKEQAITNIARTYPTSLSNLLFQQLLISFYNTFLLQFMLCKIT